jgi:hypothetical protein
LGSFQGRGRDERDAQDAENEAQWRLWSPRTPSSSCSRKSRPIANENPPRNATIRAALALPRTRADLWSTQMRLRHYSKFGGVSEQNGWRREAPVVVQSSLVTRRPATHPPRAPAPTCPIPSAGVASRGGKKNKKPYRCRLTAVPRLAQLLWAAVPRPPVLFAPLR